MTRTLLVSTVALMLIGPTVASETAAPAPQDVVDTRQSGFKKMGAAMKAISEQLKTDAPDFQEADGRGAGHQPQDEGTARLVPGRAAAGVGRWRPMPCLTSGKTHRSSLRYPASWRQESGILDRDREQRPGSRSHSVQSAARGFAPACHGSFRAD